jgi:hypothetical protein
MRFNIMAIAFMAVAIWLGTLLGSAIASMFGVSGGLIGSFAVGFVVYVIYTKLQGGGKISIEQGAIFAVLVFVAQIIAGLIGGYTGLSGGLFGLLIESVVLSIIYGYFGGKKAQAGISFGRR